MSRAAEGATPVLEPPRAPVRAMRGHHVGWIAGAHEGRWLVDFPGNPHGPLPARTTLRPDAAELRRAAAAGAEALLVFEGERSELPIVVGLLSPPVADAPAGATAADEAASDTAAADAATTEATVDGERLVHVARKEILLRCGKASIQLLSDGSVRIRGTNVLSRASATNRIRGGNVQIN